MLYIILCIALINYAACNPVTTTSGDGKVSEKSPVVDEHSQSFVSPAFHGDGEETFDSPVYEVSHGYAQKEESGRNREDFDDKDDFRWFAPNEEDAQANVVPDANEYAIPDLFPANYRPPDEIS